MSLRVAVALSVSVMVSGFVRAADIPTITRGQEVSLEAHLVPGKYVLFDFFADWCGPCRAIEPQVKRLASTHAENLAVRKVDVVNWDSPVAKQFRLRSIPHFKLYDRSGNLIAEGGAGQVLSRLSSALGGGGAGRGLVRAPSGGSSAVVPLLVLVAIAGVVAFLLLGKRMPAAAAPARPPARPGAGPGGTTYDPRVTPLWFVHLQGAFEGPFSVDQLEDLVSKRQITAEAQVRRRGDARWHRLQDVLEEAH